MSLLVLAVSLATAPIDDLKTRAQAIERLGQPVVRQAAGRGERMRWVQLEESLLAGMHVVTVTVDAKGQVTRIERRWTTAPGGATP